MQVESLIINLDYCLSCRGTCPTCVLGREERLSTQPALNVRDAVAAIEDIAPRYRVIGHLALGVGRGNNLMLPEESIGDYLTLAKAAERALKFRDAVMEISTSLVGKIEPQIERAVRIVRAFLREERRIDPRFVVVANTALSSEPYWRNLDRFIRELEQERGGHSDGNGDILQLNLATATLPDAEVLCRFLVDHRIPINLTWTPAFDPGAATEDGLRRLEEWIGRFYVLALKSGIDANVVNRIKAARELSIDSLPEAAETVMNSADNVIYVAPDGSWHHGFTSVLAEMDPVRYDPVCVGDGHARVVGDVRNELRKFARNRACAVCPQLPTCVTTGAFRVGLIALRSHPGGTSSCPSGMRAAFMAAGEA